MISVCFPSFSMNSLSTFWGNGCHRLNRIQSKDSSLSSMSSQHTSERALGGRTGSKNLLRLPGPLGPSGVPRKVCAGYCPASLSPNCPLCFSQFEWMFTFFPHLTWCEGSRWLSWLEWVPARLVTTQILFWGWGAASAGWIQVILPLGDKSDLTVTSTAKGMCDVSEQGLNSTVFLLLFLFLLQRIQGLGLPSWFSGKDSTLLMQVVWVWSLVRELGPTCHN